jgi:peroxiredoxin Q/BCP
MVKIGDSLPNISIEDDNGNRINLFELSKKKKNIVIFFYPKDNTPGCTKEACSIRDNYQQILDKGALIFGVSKDSLNSHKKFKEKYNLPFPLLSDPKLELAKAFGAYGKKRTGMGLIRSTFVTDKDGKIFHIFGLTGYPKVTTSNHGEEILNVLNKKI